ncbi:MAG: SDR family NAD(P)-dependent oxidoreductase [Anaerolineales bacterium]|nr:SDR family NAD(P)-dependent oxidoreductase [Anaerolineales bacterium]
MARPAYAYDLRDRVAVVTGATSGLGRVTAEALARAGATVGVVGRDPQRAADAARAISAAAGSGRVVALSADLSRLSAVRALAADLQSRWPALHILVNNAGAIFAARGETPDGLEQTWALNHLSYFLLTQLLLEPLRAGGAPGRSARIVNVASNAHRRGRLRWADLELRNAYSAYAAYSQSKLANILFTAELARRLAAAGDPVTANSVHPGLVHTRFAANNAQRSWRFAYVFINRLGLTPTQGADTLIYLAADPAVEAVTGRYFVRRRAVPPAAAAQDAAAARRLWEVSEQAVALPVNASVSSKE